MTNIRFGFLLLLVVTIAACKEPNWESISLPASPDGALQGEIRALSEGGRVRVRPAGGQWPEFNWLSYGACAGAEVYWANERTLVFAYDRAEIVYFVDAPNHWHDAKVLLCNRSNSICPQPATTATAVPSCSDYELS